MKSKHPHPVTRWGLSALVLALSACGGGGSEDTPSVSDSPAPIEAAASTSMLQRLVSVRSAADLGGIAPADLNNKNQVLGTVTPANGLSYAAIWSGGAASKIDYTVCPDADAVELNCLYGASHFNDDGLVLISWSHRWDYGFQLVKDGQKLGGYASSEALAVNSSGTVLAALGPSSLNTLLALKTDHLEEVPLLGDGLPGQALTLNNAGEVLGNRNDDGLPPASYVYNSISGASRTLSRPEGEGSNAAALNEEGWVAGKVFKMGDGSVDRPAYWDSNAVLHELSCPGARGEALDVNNKQVLAGACGVGESGAAGALWQQGQHVDVNTLLDAPSKAAGWVVQRVRVINDEGWMIADAVQGSGELQSVLLTPAN